MIRVYACLLLLLSATFVPAHAGVVMLGTRIIYPEGNAFAQVRFENKDAQSHLMQVWVDDGKGVPPADGANVPFVVTPPIFKINGKSQQTVRVVMGKGQSLPTDRETLYWFNFLQIPPVSQSGENSSSKVSLAFLNQVKLIYRPGGIAGRVETLSKDLTFSLKRTGRGWRLTATNPTGYYATFINKAQIKSGGKSHSVTLQPDVTLAPFSALSWDIGLKESSLNNAQISYRLINDMGAQIEAAQTIK